MHNSIFFVVIMDVHVFDLSTCILGPYYRTWSYILGNIHALLSVVDLILCVQCSGPLHLTVIPNVYNLNFYQVCIP